MKKLMKKSKASKNNFEAYACSCPTSCTCNTTAKRNWSYVKKKYKLNTTNFLFLCNC